MNFYLGGTQRLQKPLRLIYNLNFLYFSILEKPVWQSSSFLVSNKTNKQKYTTKWNK